MFANILRTKFANSKRFLPLLIGATGINLYNYYQTNYRKVSCCGIIGIVTTKDNAEQIVLEGIELLKNRGYDSVGIATLRRNEPDFLLTKLASDSLKGINCIEEIKKRGPIAHKGSFIGIGHTRWATCGGKTDNNAHPHFDQKKRVMLVHNGTLDNFQELRTELLEKGVTLTSETDSELVAQCIGLYLDEGKTLYEAVQLTIQNKIHGKWGIVVIDKEDPNKIVVARNGSPILVGLHQDCVIVASERIAFEKYTENFIEIKNHEMMEIDLEKRTDFFNLRNRILTITDKVVIQTHPRIPFTSFFEQEIHDQPETMMKALGNGSRIAGPKDSTKLGGLEQHEQQIKLIENMIIVACGSSYYASLFALSFFKKLKAFQSISCVEGSEFTEYDLPKGSAGFICVSQSGETADLRNALELAKSHGVFTLGAINSVGSQIASNVDCGVYLNCGREVAVAATKSFSSQVIVLVLMAIWMSNKKGGDPGEDAANKVMRTSLINSLRQLPLAMGQTINDCAQQCKDVAQVLHKQKSIICLGKGACASIAKEGALKLKELTYIHAEAFAAGELKHGPLALIDADNPNSTAVIIIILEDEFLHLVKTSLSEVKARGAKTIVITDCLDKLDKNKVDFAIELHADCGQLTPLLTVVPFQLLTLEICKILGRSIDMPRNLAKTVTTD